MVIHNNLPLGKFWVLGLQVCYYVKMADLIFLKTEVLFVGPLILMFFIV